MESKGHLTKVSRYGLHSFEFSGNADVFLLVKSRTKGQFLNKQILINARNDVKLLLGLMNHPHSNECLVFNIQV